MLVKTVTTTLATNTAGQVVESLPVLPTEARYQDGAGQWRDPIHMIEDARGVPIRIVSDAVVLNSAGKPVAAARGEGVGVLLFDDFERADTADGTLGVAPTGQTWDLRGAVDGGYPPLPVSAYGKITSGGFVVPGGQVVYGFVALARTPRQVTIDWSWVDDTVGAQFTTLALILTSPPVSNYIETMLHITVTNGVCKIQKRISGAWTDLNTGAQTISPSLALANTVHRLQLDYNDDTARIRIDDTRYDQSVTDADVSAVVGPVLGVEHYSGATDVRYPMTIHAVGARG